MLRSRKRPALSLLSALVVPGLVLAGAGSAAAASSPAAKNPGAVPGKYVGTSDTYYPLTFTIKRPNVEDFAAGAQVLCDNGTKTYYQQVRVDIPIMHVTRKGEFSSTVTYSGTDIAGNPVSGTYSVSGDIDNRTLSDGQLTYEIRGQSYTCRTDGPRPLVAQHR